MADKQYLTWLDVQGAINDIAFDIHEGQLVVKAIVGISRGGLIPGVMLSHLLDNIEVFSLTAKSYDEQERQKLILDVPSQTKEILNLPTTLIVDDIFDSGNTMNAMAALAPLAQRAVVAHKQPGMGKGGNILWGMTVPQDSWIVFPWEAR